jgi:hypothetical protein
MKDARLLLPFFLKTGLATIATKLFHLAAPQRAYFGLKEANRSRLFAPWRGILKICASPFVSVGGRTFK